MTEAALLKAGWYRGKRSASARAIRKRFSTHHSTCVVWRRASVGAKASNIVPSEAIAEIDIRTTPETDGRRLVELLKRHIEKQGYHIVDAAPTQEERASYDKLAMFKLGSVEAAARDADGRTGGALGNDRFEISNRAGAHDGSGATRG